MVIGHSLHVVSWQTGSASLVVPVAPVQSHGRRRMVGGWCSIGRTPTSGACV